MQKEKKVGTYQRKTKSGKLVTVKAHSAKYDAAEAAKEAMKKRKGSGSELAARTQQAKSSEVSADDFKAWYHWDAVDDPKNAAALRAEKSLKSHLGAAGYRKFFNSATESYSARGHNKAFKSLGTPSAKPAETKNAPKKEVATPAKEAPTPKKGRHTERQMEKEYAMSDEPKSVSKKETPSTKKKPTDKESDDEGAAERMAAWSRSKLFKKKSAPRKSDDKESSDKESAADRAQKLFKTWGKI